MDSGRPVGFPEEASITQFTNPSSGLSAQAGPWIMGYLVTYFEMSQVTAGVSGVPHTLEGLPVIPKSSWSPGSSRTWLWE